MSTVKYLPPDRVVCPVCYAKEQEQLKLTSLTGSVHYYVCQVCDFLFTELGERIESRDTPTPCRIV